jgi:hypothetical protein
MMGVPNRFFLLGVQGQGGLMKIPGEVSSGFYCAFSLPLLSPEYLGLMMNAGALAPPHIPFISNYGVLDCGADVNDALGFGAKLSSHELIGIPAYWPKTSVETAACRLLY